jgi:2-(1,2-epoxy-1,2-dihydrophenyl)acetyl-CoA isomerase
MLVTSETLLVEVVDGLAWVTLNRPEALNALDLELMDALVETLERLAEDPEVRCVALRGAGRAFCAGGDLSLIRRRREEAAAGPSLGAVIDSQQRVLVRQAHASRLLREMRKPTLSVVHGPAIGGGLALALACDVRVMAAEARLRIGFAARSLSGDYGISYLLVHTVGSARARELLLLDPELDGAEAYRLGLATETCALADAQGLADALARRLADGPTIAFGRMKHNVLAAETGRFEALLQIAAYNQRIPGNPADAPEAGAAFAERRPARFRGV